MRTDVKLGMVCALVLVLATGGYFMFRGDKQKPIPLAEGGSKSPAATPAPQSGKGAPNAPGTALAPRGNAPLKDGAAAAKPPVTPVVRQPRSTVALGPNAQPATTPPNPVGAPNSPPIQPSTPTVKPSEPVAILPPAPGSATVSPNTSELTAGPVLGKEAGPVATNDQAKTGTATADAAAGRGLTPLTSVPPPSIRPASSPSIAGGTPAPVPLSDKSASNIISGAPTSGRAGAETTPSSTPPAIERKADHGAEGPRVAVDTHRVQPGDTFTSLAQTYYGDSKYAKILVDANPELGNPNTLRLGAVVKVPPLPSDVDARAGGPARSDKPVADVAARITDGKRFYTVKSGDSFYSIAKTQLGNASRWKELLSLNSKLVHGDPTSLQPGQKLVLPES